MSVAVASLSDPRAVGVARAVGGVRRRLLCCVVRSSVEIIVWIREHVREKCRRRCRYYTFTDD